MNQVGETKKKTGTKRAGDALVGIGTVLAVISFLLALLAAFNGGTPIVPFSMMLAFLLLVMIGYLKRIAVAVETRD